MNRLLTVAALCLLAAPAAAHDNYGSLWTKDHSLPCCGGESAGAARDCWRTIYRERGDQYEFRTMAGDWVNVPQDKIQFTPIPGDVPSGDTHEAHLCYRDDASTLENYHDHGSTERIMKTVSGGEIVFFCAIIPPGGS